jgi:hypothetical protein
VYARRHRYCLQCYVPRWPNMTPKHFRIVLGFGYSLRTSKRSPSSLDGFRSFRPVLSQIKRTRFRCKILCKISGREDKSCTKMAFVTESFVCLRNVRIFVRKCTIWSNGHVQIAALLVVCRQAPAAVKSTNSVYPAYVRRSEGGLLVFCGLVLLKSIK